MYALPYSNNDDVEHKHYKLEWISLLGAVTAALVLLIVAYFVNDQEGLKKVAVICIIVAVFSVMLSVVALFTHHYIDKKMRHKASACDDPPSYKDAWRRAFYSRGMSEIEEAVNNNSSVSSHLLCDNLEYQRQSSPSGPLSIPPYTPHSSSRVHPSTCNKSISITIESQERRTDDLPSYDEAMQSIDLSSIQKVKQDMTHRQ